MLFGDENKDERIRALVGGGELGEHREIKIESQSIYCLWLRKREYRRVYFLLSAAEKGKRN